MNVMKCVGTGKIVSARRTRTIKSVGIRKLLLEQGGNQMNKATRIYYVLLLTLASLMVLTMVIGSHNPDFILQNGKKIIELAEYGTAGLVMFACYLMVNRSLSTGSEK